MNRRDFLRGIAGLFLSSQISEAKNRDFDDFCTLEQLIMTAPDLNKFDLPLINTIPGKPKDFDSNTKYDSRNVIVCSYDDKKVQLYSSVGLIKEYDGALFPRNKYPKVRDGDKRFPLGVYFLTDISSLKADKGNREYNNQVAKMKSLPNVYKGLPQDWQGDTFMEMNYESNDVNLYLAWKKFGLINAWDAKVLRYFVPTHEDFISNKLGDGIAIHGRGKKRGDWSKTIGCVAMHDDDLHDLLQYVNVNTPVINITHFDSTKQILDERYDLLKYRKLLNDALVERWGSDV